MKNILIIIGIIAGICLVIGLIIYFLKHVKISTHQHSSYKASTPTVKAVNVSQKNAKGVSPVAYSP